MHDELFHFEILKKFLQLLLFSITLLKTCKTWLKYAKLVGDANRYSCIKTISPVVWCHHVRFAIHHLSYAPAFQPSAIKLFQSPLHAHFLFPAVERSAAERHVGAVADCF